MYKRQHENCSISIVDISETDYNDYLELLKQEGFSIIEDVYKRQALWQSHSAG